MKQAFYILKNNSASEGTYLINGEYKVLFPGQEVTLDRAPSNKTENLITLVFRKEVGEEKILNKKTRRKN